MKREKVRIRLRERERQESKNTMYCSKWALARSCVTTSSIAHKENVRDKEQERQRGETRKERQRAKRMKVRGATARRER